MNTQYLTNQEAQSVREKKTAVVERELDAIVERHGSVSSELLVDIAKAENHPLHRYFEWDDTAGAHKYRLAQATNMILAAKFVCVIRNHEDSPPTVTGVKQEKRVQLRKLLPAFDGEHGFRRRTDVLADNEARQNLVTRKIASLRSWCQGVVDIKELDPVRIAVESALPS